MTPEELHLFIEEFESGMGSHASPRYVKFRRAILQWLNTRVEQEVEEKIRGYKALQERADGLQVAFDQVEAQLIAMRGRQ